MTLTAIRTDPHHVPCVVIGFDGYNASLTGDRVATLGVNCGMSTRRQGVIVEETDDLHIPKDKETTIRDRL